MKLGQIAGAVGRGLLAGVAGTAAITVSQAIEMKLRHRQESATPAKAAEKTLGLKPVGPQEEQRFSQLVHWGYGTAWGGVRGLLDAFGLKGLAADAVHFGAISGTAMVMLPALKVAPPAKKQPPEEIAIESVHHLVYALATGLAFAYLSAQADR